MKAVRGTKMVMLEPSDTSTKTAFDSMFDDVRPEYRAGLKARYAARLKQLISLTEMRQVAATGKVPSATLARVNNDPVMLALDAERERYRCVS